jgi:hypothetical protein
MKGKYTFFLNMQNFFLPAREVTRRHTKKGHPLGQPLFNCELRLIIIMSYD